MTVKEFIEKKLNDLKFTEKAVGDFKSNDDLVGYIFKTLMSKKFRKYKASPELIVHIKNAIKLNIEQKKPIDITFPHGAYKLWRLEEAPEVDWAELFSMMYYAKWLKPMCEIYKPGIIFNFFVDDLIVPIMDNIKAEEVNAYLNSQKNLIGFLEKYLPQNMKITVTRVGGLFESPKVFYELLEKSIEELSKKNPIFTEYDLQMTELNVRPTDEQLKDPKWREKVRLIHDAYMIVKRSVGYYPKPDKILVFSQQLPSGRFLAVGTTKTSIAKFWVGIGALKKTVDGYQEYVLSPSQIEKTKFFQENISIEGLSGKNFNRINIF